MQYILGSLSPDPKRIKKKQVTQWGHRKILLLLWWLVVYFQLMAIQIFIFSPVVQFKKLGQFLGQVWEVRAVSVLGGDLQQHSPGLTLLLICWTSEVSVRCLLKSFLGMQFISSSSALSPILCVYPFKGSAKKWMGFAAKSSPDINPDQSF